MDFLVLRPEVNSSRMFSGMGSGPMLAAARAWDGLAAELQSAANSFGRVTSGLSSGPWQGPSAAAMTEAAAPYLAWLTAAASKAEQSGTQVRAAAEAFETAFAATVHPAAVRSNRAQLVSLARSNMLGLNAPAIAAIEADYERMWAQDVAAMVGYHGAASAAVSQLMPWQHATQNVSTQVAESSLTRITVAPAYIFENQPLIAPLLHLPPYSVLASDVGENWLPGTTPPPTVVKYPATAGLLSGFFKPTADKSMAIGVQALNADILTATANPDAKVVVAGASLGAMTIDREQAYLATAPNAPSPDQLSFVEFANPERGIADTYLPAGFHVPLLGYTVGNPPVSQYDTTIIYHQYEGLSNPPDRPWNLLADANAMAGVNHYHLYTGFTSPDQAVEVGQPVTNSLGGTTTTYMVPASILPMLLPLQTFGVPAPIVDHLNSVLTPMVNQGYSQYDPTGGPYFSHGELVWPS